VAKANYLLPSEGEKELPRLRMACTAGKNAPSYAKSFKKGDAQHEDREWSEGEGEALRQTMEGDFRSREKKRSSRGRKKGKATGGGGKKEVALWKKRGREARCDGESRGARGKVRISRR